MWWVALVLAAAAGVAVGQQECYCSGVASQCREATSHYWATMRLAAADTDHGFTLTDKEQGEQMDVEYLPDTREVHHRYPRGTGRAGLYYWALPDKLMGNRVSAYGGNLTFYQRLVYSGEASVQDADVILVGDGITLQTQVEREGVASGQELRSRVTLWETGWLVVREGIPGQATKADVLQVLANLRAVLVRATVSLTMQETMLRKVMVDISVPQPTGGPAARGLEECRCPPQYRGLSCEECAPGHSGHPECRPLPGLETLDDSGSEGQGTSPQEGQQDPRSGQDPYSGRQPDPYGREQDPYGGNPNPYREPQDPYRGGGDPYGEVDPYRGGGDPFSRQQTPGERGGPTPLPDIFAPQGYTGPPAPGLAPGEPPLDVNIGGPKVQTVRPGETVTFDCSAKPKIPLQDPLTYSWAKQNGLLPAGRSREDGFGLLVLSTVETDDSGTYTCTVTAGRFVVEDSLQLDVSEDPRASGGSDRGPGARYGGPGGSYGGPRGGYGGSSSVSIEPPYHEVVAGGDAMFECLAAAGGPVTWSRGGYSPLSHRVQADGARLRFQRVEVEDEGEYVCEAAGGLERAQLYVQEASGSPWGGPAQSPRGPSRPPAPRCLGPTVTIEPPEQTVPQGQDTTLTCNSSPPGRIEWMKVGEELTSPQLTVAGEQVEVRAALVSDRGMYVCTVTTSCGSARASSILEVEPREPPVVELYPGPHQTVTMGESVLFQCRYLSGIPSPTISWSREDGRPLPTSAELLPGGVIRINSVTGQEAGLYRCVATNAAGTTQALATLEVQQPPTISLEPAGPQITLTEGSQLNIVCTVRGGDPPPSLSWRRIGDMVETVGGASPTFSLPAVRKEDEGTYACIATNSAGEAEERLQVIVRREEQQQWPEQRHSWPKQDPQGREGWPVNARRRPSQAPGEHEVHTRIGSNVTLNCLTGGEVPPGARAVWSRSSQSRPFSRRHRQQDGLLSILGVMSSDHGPYMCQLIDREGTVLFELRANLIVKGKIGMEGDGRVAMPDPSRSRDPFNWGGNLPPANPAPWPDTTPTPSLKLKVDINPMEKSAAAGETVEFHCTAVALVRLQEPTTLTWIREDAAIPEGRGRDNGDGHLQLHGVQVEDSGTYICLARSGHYLHQAHATLLVTSDPAMEYRAPQPAYQLPSPLPPLDPYRHQTPQPSSPYQQEDPRDRYSEPAKGYQPPAMPYQAPAKGYQPPTQYRAPAKGYQPPEQPHYQPPEQPHYQPPEQPHYRPPQQPHYQPPQQPNYQPTQQPHYQPPSQPHYYPPVGPSGAAGEPPAPYPAPEDYTEASGADYEGEDYSSPSYDRQPEDPYSTPGQGYLAPWEDQADEDDYYEDDGPSPIAYSSEDYRRPGYADGPRQYQPYAGGQWAGEETVWGGCSSGEVQCGRLEECVSRGLVCDGEIDCRDGSDEQSCPPKPI